MTLSIEDSVWYSIDRHLDKVMKVEVDHMKVEVDHIKVEV